MVDGKRIPIQNIYYMLAYAYQTLHLSEYQPLSTEQFDNVTELYAAILAIGIPVLVRGGLMKEYQTVSNQSLILRGKVDFSASIKQNALVNQQLVVNYDEFLEDHQLNQIIKATLVYLHRHQQVSKKHQRQLLSYLPYFAKVADVKLSLALWKNRQKHRQNLRYEFIVEICRFVYEALLLSTNNGKKRQQHFQDDQRLASLYEKFIFAFYKRETNFGVLRPQIKWATDNDFTEALPIMQTDLVLETAGKVLIVDTKFYSQNLLSRFENSPLKQRSNNLYQIFAYVNNWPAKAGVTVGGMLLYARTQAAMQPNHRYEILGTSIMVTSLDLMQSFAGIKRDLLALANNYFA